MLLVDDHRMFLEGLNSIFSDSEEISVVNWVTSGEEAIECLSRDDVHIVVTDINMPGMSGVELNQEIKKKWPVVKTLMLSTESNPNTIQKLAQSNADGYLLKNAEKDELVTAIKGIQNGDKYFSREVQHKLTESVFSNQSSAKKNLRLSKREKEVLVLIGDELTAEEIAEKLCISQHTVNSHRKNLLSKLGAKNTAGLIKYALVNGLIK